MEFLMPIQQAIVKFCEWLCGPLVPVGSAIKQSLATVPLGYVRGALALAFLALAVWCLTLPRRYVMEDAGLAVWWNDLRRWAALAMAIQIALYLTL